LLAVYCFNYFMGKRANSILARYWVQENKEIFDNEFSHVGVGGATGGALLDQESVNMYKFYASGRVNCSYALTTLELKRRQDLMTMFIFNFIWPEKDRLNIEIPIDVKQPLPTVFAIVKKREAKAVHANNPDLKNFCKKLPFPELESTYTVFGENLETAEFVLTGPVVALLKKYEKIIQMIQLTDQKFKNKLLLQADFLLPSKEQDYKEFKNILKMLFFLVDNICNFRLSAPAKAKAEKERSLLEAIKAKEEAERQKEELQKKKTEDKKKKDEALKQLPKDKQKKLEDKEHKKDVKKKMSQKVVKVA